MTNTETLMFFHAAKLHLAYQCAIWSNSLQALSQLHRSCDWSAKPNTYSSAA